MKKFALTLVLTLTTGLMPHALAQGPAKETTDTVARPRPKPGDKTSAPPEEREQDKIESKYKKKPGEVAEGPSLLPKRSTGRPRL